ncbi:MAG: hypothetical protein QNJ67_18195 [Kiloniellales bacterium]|nr:hypothetical protein [Kiloniellales bacterium]
MSITTRSLETLIDLVEIKLSCMEIYDREDAREVANLESCLDELNMLAGRPKAPRREKPDLSLRRPMPLRRQRVATA